MPENIGGVAAKAGEEALNGNFLSAAYTVVSSFIGGIFGGPSKSDKDREAKVKNWLDNVWPALLSDMENKIDVSKSRTGEAQKFIAKLTRYPEINAQYGTPCWELYVHFLLEKIEITKDASQSKTDACTRIDNLMGTGALNKGSGALQMLEMYYRKVAEYNAQTTGGGGGGGGAIEGGKEVNDKDVLPSGGINKKHLMIGAVVLLALVLFRKR